MLFLLLSITTIAVGAGFVVVRRKRKGGAATS
jgi:hypothetical protein